MNPERQRIKIAEAYGYTDVRLEEWENVDIKSREIAYGTALRGTLNRKRTFVPDYLNDLNAMNEVEKIFNRKQKLEYAGELGYIVALTDNHDESPEVFYCVYASAAQRAEAFLRTLGLWEENEKKT